MRHANSGLLSLVPAPLASLLLWLEGVAYNVLFMTADQGAFTQVGTAVVNDCG